MTNGFSAPPFDFVSFVIEYNISTLSGDAIIKDFSLEIISADGFAIVEEFILPFPSDHELHTGVGLLFDEEEFPPTDNISVQLGVSVGVFLIEGGSLEGFVALYSQIPPTQVAIEKLVKSIR